MVQGMGCVVGGEEQAIRVSWLLPVLLSLCVLIRCCAEGRYQQHFSVRIP